MSVSLTGSRSELGSLLARRHAASATEHVHINLAGQQANSLLHDGHRWKDFARTTLAGTRRAMRSARIDGAPMFVHASFAFVHAVDQGARVDEPLRAAVNAILECEALALSGAVPACVVRLGYLYGPESDDLCAYRTAFRLGRPYWSGPRKALQCTSISSMPPRPCSPRPGHETGKISTPTVSRFHSRSCGAFAHRSAGAPVTSADVLKPRRVIIREEHMQQSGSPDAPWVARRACRMEGEIF
jgi:hypothetical protein